MREGDEAAGPRVAIATLGCKVSRYDTAAISEQLRAVGCALVPFAPGADVYLVNGCTVTGAAEAESRRLARRARRLNPTARVVLTGCAAEAAGECTAREGAIDCAVGLGCRAALVDAVLGRLPAGVRVVRGDGRRGGELRPGRVRSFPGRTRALLKVQDGCDYRCSYCIVPRVRGPSRSVPLAMVVQELDELSAAGFREVVLTGVHLGSYGRDLRPRTDIVELLAALAARRAVPRLRLSSLDPPELTERLVRLMAADPAICPHLHVPVQSGDAGMLRRMGRRYGPALAHERLAMAREFLPEAAIGTDLIVGFPGEGEAEFMATLRFVATSPLTYLHVFPFSPRPGTRAAEMPGRVPPAVVAARAARLRRLGARLRGAFARRFVGATVEVLAEGGRRDGWLQGYTRNYLRVSFRGAGALAGREVAVRARRVEGTWLEGELEGENSK